MTHDDLTGMYELLDAVEAVIKAADPAKREVLARRYKVLILYPLPPSTSPGSLFRSNTESTIACSS